MEGRQINQPEELACLATGLVPDVQDMLHDIETRAGEENIVPFDDVAYSKGIWNVPTFFIGGKKYAEQPYAVLARAVQSVLK
jgi:2-hydroxychromene-2-carboxylate isomerase